MRNKEFAESNIVEIKPPTCLQIPFQDTEENCCLEILKEILPNGYLRITQKIINKPSLDTNIDIYHKQMSVLPYAGLVGSVAISLQIRNDKT